MTKVYRNRNVAYALNQPTLVGAPVPIIALRDPGANDTAEIGTTWINTTTNAVFIITSIVGGVPAWTSTAGGAEVVDSITALFGPNSLQGPTSINVIGAALTTIGTGGTGQVRIGNATGNTAVTGSLTASTSLNATGAVTAGTSVTAGTNVTATAGQVTAGTAVIAGTGIQSTTGNITALVGNVASGDSFVLTAVNGTVAFQPGPIITANAIAPTSVAPVGSLCLVSSGTGTNNRAYINTTGANVWTAIVTVA
jgi:hypothetical protein